MTPDFLGITQAKAVGDNAVTPQELMAKVAEVVGGGKVQTLTLPYASQRRIVLEAVAFGTRIS